MGALLVILGVVGVVLIAGSSFAHDVEVVGGRRYRFFFRIAPPVDADAAELVRKSLQGAGASSITMQSSAEETTGSYTETVVLTRKVPIGAPFMGTSLVFTSVEEIR